MGEQHLHQTEELLWHMHSVDQTPTRPGLRAHFAPTSELETIGSLEANTLRPLSHDFFEVFVFP